MLKILSGDQVKELDRIHIQNAGISSHELMERAALSFINWWKSMEFPKNLPVFVFCGAGNNGGDGFAIARLLFKEGWEVQVFRCFEEGSVLSADAQKNLDWVPEGVLIYDLKEFNSSREGLLIDSFLGVGLKSPIRNSAVPIIECMNSFPGIKISIDLPSGLLADSPTFGPRVKADFTVTFAFPKLALFFPENSSFSGKIVLADIGISESEYASFPTSYFFIQEKDILSRHRVFGQFSHKGDFGKVAIVAGSKGKMGAAILCSKAALRTGSGLVTAFVPKDERGIIQSAVPEVMCEFDENTDWNKFDSLGVGPAIGLDKKDLLQDILKACSKPIVLDADAITLIASNQDLISLIPKNSILTPHLLELERLIGKSTDHLDRLMKVKEFCMKWQLNLLIKGAYSVLSLVDGRQLFNSSGTQYMAKAGAGDVLTGMLTSFLGQGYTPENALICGVYHHGKAGELAGQQNRRSTIASDISENIGKTYTLLNVL
ncbi:bifunctional ADP-dependent NAD(P)H-hydrate dehydratase/NAD(P)H-hydrate epimerase [Algoriphagus sp. oki45]|uniref:NAD(P)H-hydrate dehydratase n=1 Tax=Algoriphagus sp. oki45 TaxID=3067294 RepID=UPI0027F0CE17|nr:bifunctional ADP-dependent NAD(P)H-hydrate dehydratase/NAD(P)H-hydrate epimerase [Algoriphagus sp. oki45]